MSITSSEHKGQAVETLATSNWRRYEASSNRMQKSHAAAGQPVLSVLPHPLADPVAYSINFGLSVVQMQLYKATDETRGQGLLECSISMSIPNTIGFGDSYICIPHPRLV